MKKIAIILILMVCALPAFAYDAEQIDELQRQKSMLTSQYEQKQKELSEITMKLHELNAKISEAVKNGPEEKEYKPVPMSREY